MTQDAKQVPEDELPQGPEREGAPEAPDGLGARERENAVAGEEALETRTPLQPGAGPSSPTGDALLDGTGTRHGVEARDERPGGG